MAVWIPVHENSFTTWESRAEYFEQLRAAAAATPGVTQAAISSNATPPRNGWDMRFEIQGRTNLEQQNLLLNLVSPGYFSALREPLLQGRVWSDAENHAGAPVAVVNRAFANLYFPNGDAIGQAIRLPAFENRPPILLSVPNAAGVWLRIVGIVADARNAGLREPVKPAAFVPFTISMHEGTQILVRSEVPPLSLLHAVRKQLTQVNADQQTARVVSELDKWITDGADYQQDHLIAWIFGAFSVLALALAAVGLYSVVSYTVTQRTNEFGIRMALGAQRGHVLRIVFASTLTTVGSGIVLGLGLTVVLSGVLAAWTEENSRDPVVLLAATAVLVAVAGIACAFPARRASRVEPMTALRYE